MKAKRKNLVEKAKEVADLAESWADLSNALFDPVAGLVARAYPTRKEREAFLRSGDYAKLRELLSASVATHGLVEGATPKKSGRFLVRIPQSLHAALEREATEEGVSLNQLVIAKLAFQLHRLAESSVGKKKA